MRVHVLSIGSELIVGHLTDTNATFLAQELVALGAELLHVTQVGDDRERLTATIRHALREADVVVCTGGVGPTEDDLTREAIASVVDQEPAVDPTLLDAIRDYFAGRGMVMPERNAKQAWLIPAAEALSNPVGTAPGWFVRYEGHVVVAMPGVPREMVRMWQEQVIPRLRPLLPARSVRSLTLKTLGVGESMVEERLADLVALANPIVATYAKDDGVHVRITAIASGEPEAQSALDATVAAVRARLDDAVYADDGTPLGVALLQLVRAKDHSIAVSEFGTAGRFAALLLGDPTASDVVRGCTAAPPVDTGADARGAAVSAVELTGAAIGVGVVATFEPTDQGLYRATVDVAIAGAVDGTERFPLHAAFAEVQRRAALHAADVLRRALR